MIDSYMIFFNARAVMLKKVCHDILFMFYVCIEIDGEASIINIGYWLINNLSNDDIKVC